MIVAESYGGEDEPVDSLVASLVGVGVEVRSTATAPAVHERLRQVLTFAAALAGRLDA